MEFIIDTRENCIKDYFKDFEYVTIKQLDIGDILIKYNQEIILIIERKTIKDLSASIRDGRHREQKKRLLNSIELNKIFYLIEGEYQNDKYLLPKKTLISSILNTLIRDNIKIIKTRNINETLEYLNNLYDKLKKNPKDLLTPKNDDYISTLKVKKKENLTPQVCFQLQLNQIPGVSNNISSCIINNYPSMFLLIKKYQELESEQDKLNLLESLKYDIANNKQRKVGKVISNRIYRYLNLIE